MNGIQVLSGHLTDPAASWANFWAGFLEFLKIIVWPLTITCIFLFFRQVFAYFLLSMKKINIFGAGIEWVKDPMQVVEEMAKQMDIDRQEKQRQQDEIKSVQAEAETLRGKVQEQTAEAKSWEALIDRTIKILEETNRQKSEIEKENAELKSSTEKQLEKAREEGVNKGMDIMFEYIEKTYDLKKKINNDQEKRGATQAVSP